MIKNIQTQTENTYKISNEQQTQIINDLRNQIKQEHVQYEQIIKMIEDKNLTERQELKQTIKSLQQNNAECSTAAINNLTTALTPVINSYIGSAEQKGSLGEQVIYNLLSDNPRYESGIVTNTSGEKASGDLLFAWKQLRCLIEVKNKKVITPDDINKFERDIIQSPNINCAIFISLRTKQLPGKTREAIQFDLVNNVPVIYTYITAGEHLHYSLICLEHIVQHSSLSDVNLQKLTNYYRGYYKQMTHLSSFFKKEIKNKKSELHRLEKEYMNAITIHDNLKKNLIYFEPEELEIKNNTDDAVEEIVESLSLENIEESKKRIIHYYIDRCSDIKKPPVTKQNIESHFNITPYVFLKKFGGFKQLISDATKQFLPTVITDDIIQSLKKYKATNNKFPHRELLIKNYITRRTIDKISRITNTRKALDIIYNYIDEQKDLLKI